MRPSGLVIRFDLCEDGCRIADIGIWQGSRRARFYCGPCVNSDVEMGLSRQRPVGGLRLRGATDDDPHPLLPYIRRGLYG